MQKLWRSARCALGWHAWKRAHRAVTREAPLGPAFNARQRCRWCPAIRPTTLPVRVVPPDRSLTP